MLFILVYRSYNFFPFFSGLRIVIRLSSSFSIYVLCLLLFTYPIHATLSSYIITLPNQITISKDNHNHRYLKHIRSPTESSAFDEHRKQSIILMMKALEDEQRKYQKSKSTKYDPYSSMHITKDKDITGAEYTMNITSDVMFEAMITGTFQHILDGFTADLSLSAVRFLEEQFGADVYPDIIVSAPFIGTPMMYPMPNTNHSVNRRIIQESSISNEGIIDAVSATSWGLDRIDQLSLPLDGIYHRFFSDSPPSSSTTTPTNNHVDIYFIDSGLRQSHYEFQGRTITGQNFLPDQLETNYSDCAGHGSHVTGTATGNTIGIGRQANIVIVRVLSCDAAGALRYVLRGLDWTLSQIKETLTANPSQRIVINLSVATQRMTVL